MTDKELIAALRRNMVETGSLICLGCGHEHWCGAHGCVILREAADRIEQLSARQENNPPLTLEELRGMDGEPVWIEDLWQDFYGWELSADAQDYCAERDTKQYGTLWLAYRRKPEEDTKWQL